MTEKDVHCEKRQVRSVELHLKSSVILIMLLNQYPPYPPGFPRPPRNEGPPRIIDRPRGAPRFTAPPGPEGPPRTTGRIGAPCDEGAPRPPGAPRM